MRTSSFSCNNRDSSRSETKLLTFEHDSIKHFDAFSSESFLCLKRLVSLPRWEATGVRTTLPFAHHSGLASHHVRLSLGLAGVRPAPRTGPGPSTAVLLQKCHIWARSDQMRGYGSGIEISSQIRATGFSQNQPTRSVWTRQFRIWLVLVWDF